MTADIIDELEWRGLLAQSTDLDALRKDLDAGPVTLYAGFDPTGDSLHAGNLMPMLTLRRFQLFGHRPIVLAGGATGLIGDPSGRESERALADRDEIAARVERLRPQLERFVDLSTGLLVNNLDWTASLSAIDFLREVGKHFSVNVMLGKESISARLNGEGLSYTEFSYALLQSYDYLRLYRDHGCRLQIGATDQWGNITAGLDFIRRNGEREPAHALTVPLVTDSSGRKFGKSTGGGSLWLDPALTSPYSFFQYWINVADADVGRYLRFFTFLDREEIEALERETAERPAARSAARRLAAELTTLVHGARETEAVIAASAALFGRGELRDLDPATLRGALEEAGLHRVDGLTANIVDLLEATGLCATKSEARRTVSGGGASLNNVPVTDPEFLPGPSDLLAGGLMVLRRGRRQLAGIEVSTARP